MTVKKLTHTQEIVLNHISTFSGNPNLYFSLIEDKIFKIQIVKFFDGDGSCIASGGNVYKFESVKLRPLIFQKSIAIKF